MKLFDFIKHFFSGHPHVWWFCVLLGGAVFYEISNVLPLERTAISCALDGYIPFVPAFIIPYLFWYVYVGGLMVLLFFRYPKDFVRQSVTMLAGIAVADLCFLLFPSCVDFRPDAEGPGLLLWIVRFTFSEDRPVNVFPSLHIIEAIIVHFTAFTFGPLKKKVLLRMLSVISTVLICLSTVFVKQHSVIDVAAAVLVCAAVITVTQLYFRHSRRKEL